MNAPRQKVAKRIILPALYRLCLSSALFAAGIISSQPSYGGVVADGYTFYAITNGTGQVSITGTNNLAVYGTGLGSGTADTQSVYTQFNPVNLSLGDSIRFEFTLNNLKFAASSSGMRIAFANMPASVGDVGTPNPNWTNGTPRDTYTMLIPVVTNSVPGAGSVLLRKATNISNPLAGTGIQLPTLGAYSLPNGSQTTSIVFEIVRDTATSVQISGNVGSMTFNVSDATNPIFSFNTLQLGLRTYANAGDGFTTSNFNVESIPEPSSGALLLLGSGIAGWVWAARRRQRK